MALSQSTTCRPFPFPIGLSVALARVLDIGLHHPVSLGPAVAPALGPDRAKPFISKKI